MLSACRCPARGKTSFPKRGREKRRRVEFRPSLWAVPLPAFFREGENHPQLKEARSILVCMMIVPQDNLDEVLDEEECGRTMRMNIGIAPYRTFGDILEQGE